MNERKFTVLVPTSKRNIAYQPMRSRPAIALMQRLTARGYKPIAATDCNGVAEVLTLKEMLNTCLP